MRLLSIIVSAVVICSASFNSYAADIYINGQQVRGVTGQTFENCKVTFRANGDVDIEIPGFKLVPVAAMGEQSKQVTEAAALDNRYFLYTQTASAGRIPYSYEVYVNGQVVKVFSSANASVVQEITLYMKKGVNEVEVRCTYEPDKAGAVADRYSIIIGRGAPKDGNLEINEVLNTFDTTGTDQGNKVQKITIEAK